MNVLRPDTTHLPLGYFITHPNPLRQGLCFGVYRYTSMVHEDGFASIVWMDEAVTTLAVKPTPHGSRFLVERQNLPPFSWQQERSIGELFEVSVS
jgi:hypothetical protein